MKQNINVLRDNLGTFFLGIFILGIGKITSYLFGESEGIRFIISATNIVPFFLIIVSIVYSLIYSFSNQDKFKDKISVTEDQVNQYDSLKIYQSYSGKSFLILFISGIIGTLSLLISYIYNLAISNNDVIVAFLLTSVFLLSFFVYRRKRWAIILAIILYFAGMLSSLYQMGLDDVKKGYYLGQSLVFLTFIFVFLRALKIEKLREGYASNNNADYSRNENSDEKKRLFIKTPLTTENSNILAISKNSSTRKITFFKWLPVGFIFLIIIFMAMFYQRKMKVAECIVNFTEQQTIIPIEYTSLNCKDGSIADRVICHLNTNRPNKQDLYRLYCEDIYKLWK